MVAEIPEGLFFWVDLPREGQRVHRGGSSDARATFPTGNRNDKQRLQHLWVQQRVVPAVQRAPVVRNSNALAVAQRPDQADDILADLDG